ncbi:MAG: hypothetical protein ACPG8W_02060 [Candidatus Promineifilaceae bacterium]
MGFLRKLFSRKPKKYVDERGLYFHADCHKCHNVLRIRIDKQYDLNRQDDGGGFVWRKTLVCPKCFNKMQANMTFDGSHKAQTQEISGGKYVAAPQDGDSAERGFD